MEEVNYSKFYKGNIDIYVVYVVKYKKEELQ